MEAPGGGASGSRAAAAAAAAGAGDLREAHVSLPSSDAAPPGPSERHVTTRGRVLSQASLAAVALLQRSLAQLDHRETQFTHALRAAHASMRGRGLPPEARTMGQVALNKFLKQIAAVQTDAAAVHPAADLESGRILALEMQLQLFRRTEHLQQFIASGLRLLAAPLEAHSEELEVLCMAWTASLADLVTERGPRARADGAGPGDAESQRAVSRAASSNSSAAGELAAPIGSGGMDAIPEPLLPGVLAPRTAPAQHDATAAAEEDGQVEADVFRGALTGTERVGSTEGLSDKGESEAGAGRPDPWRRLLSALGNWRLTDLARAMNAEGVFSLRDLLALNPASVERLGAMLTAGPLHQRLRSISMSSDTTLPSARLVSPLDIGSVRILSLLGEGQFGAVYRGRMANEADCVVKMIEVRSRRNVFRDVMMAVDEAKRLMVLNHPHIVRYFDVFGHQVDEEELDSGATRRRSFVCIQMEYCELGALTDLVLERSLLLDDILDILRQTCLALQYAHESGIIHCDLKLDNLFIVPGRSSLPRDIVKLGDFGLSLPFRQEADEHDAHGAVPGEGGRGLFEAVQAMELDDEDGGDRMDQADWVQPAGPAQPESERVVEADTPLVHESRFVLPEGQRLCVGTLAYQPPECFTDTLAAGGADRQARPGQPVAASLAQPSEQPVLSPAIDCWALGCLLFEMATGQNVPLGHGSHLLGAVAAASPARWAQVLDLYAQQTADALHNAQVRPAGPGAPQEDKDRLVAMARTDLVAKFIRTLSREPQSRPRPSHLLAQPYLQAEAFFFHYGDDR